MRSTQQFLRAPQYFIRFYEQDNTNIISPMVDPDDPYSILRWSSPVGNFDLSQRYGGSEPHKGVDFRVYKVDVYPTASGSVMGAGQYTKDADYTTAIKYVTIKHDDLDPNGNNLITRYLDSFSVKTGNKVTKPG